MENQEIKRVKGPKFTEQEDTVIKLALENSKGNMDDRCKVAAEALNRPLDSIKGRYYTLMYLGKMERIMFPRSPKYLYDEIEAKIAEVKEPEPEPKKPVRTYKPRKKKTEEVQVEVKTSSKWRRIIDILFNK